MEESSTAAKPAEAVKPAPAVQTDKIDKAREEALKAKRALAQKKLNELNNRLHECYKGINEAIPSLIKNAKCASHHLMKEIENKDSFTTGIVKENAKELRQLSEKLAGIYEGVREPLLKLASMSEDIGQKLDRYYNIR